MGQDFIRVEGIADGQHQGVKPGGGHEVAPFILHHLPDRVFWQAGGLPIAPVQAPGHTGIRLPEEVHQAVIPAAVANDNGGIGMKGGSQLSLPLAPQAAGILRAVKGVEKQAPVHLGDDGAAEPLPADVIRQHLMVDHQGLTVGV